MPDNKSLGVAVTDALFIALVVIVAYTMAPIMTARNWVLDKAAK